MKRLLWVVVVLLLSMYGQAMAATLNFNDSSSLAALQASGTCATWNNAWDYSAGEFSCNAQVTFSSGDQIRTTSASVIIRGNAGISGSNLSVGTSTNRVNLTTTHGVLQISGSSTVYGNLQTSSGAVTVQSSTVNGSITSSGALTLNAASISGSVSTSGTGSITNGSSLGAAVSIGNGLTSSGSTYLSTLAVTNGGLTTNTSVYHGAVTVRSHILSTNDTFLSDVTSTNGRLEFTGGSVTGLIYTPCCTLTTNNTNLAGGATVQSGITITGGTIAGDYTMTSNNPAVVSNVTMTSGSITSASTVTITNSTLGSDTSPVLVTSVSGNISVNNSQVYGDLTTPGYGVVQVNGSSEVVGSCVPIDEPLFACGGVASVTRESYWRFDEVLWNGTANEVKDSSLEQRDGRARNSAVVAQLTPSPASCTYGDFQSVGASNHPFVDINRNTYFHDSDEFGFTLWLKMNASAQAAGSQTIMAYGGAINSANGRFQLTRESGGNLRFTIRMTGGTTRFVEVSGANIFNDQWQHIAFSYSKNNRRMRLYVNNQLVDDTPNSSIDNADATKTPNDGSGNFAIGALPDGTSGIRGQIDEVRFFNRELSTSDVKNMYEQTATCINECFTENFSNDANWYLTQLNSTPPSLRTAPSRLRLTENSQNQSTSITFKRSFPAAGNKMTIEFDHYAYGGNGADGIAVVLSDATVSPVPGSYGGSLGYAQRTNVNPAQSGFAGGWLGIGFDEFGNYSQATEGRVGGTTARPNAIGVRAASSTNFGWLGGTNTLSPALSAAGSTLARGDRYRITIDSRIQSPQTVSFQLERRLAGGSAYSTLLTSANLLSLGQPAPPANLLLSYTGSTGDNTNFHEITNIQVCTQQPSTPVEIGPSVHHFELSYPVSGLTCESSAVTIRACADASCSTLYTGAATLTLNSTNSASWVGGNQVTLSNGLATKYLSKTASGDSVISIASASVATSAAAVCKEGSSVDAACSMTFLNTGLRFSTVPNQVAGVQSPGKVKLQVVRTDTNTGACVARVTPATAVRFAYQCVNPTSCVAGQSFEINDSVQSSNGSSCTTSSNFNAISANPVSAVTQYTSLNRCFSSSSAETEFNIKYSDVGQIKLHAQLQLAASGNEPALSLSQESNAFVVRPYQINVTTALSSATADPANAANPQTLGTGTGFIAAGEDFQLYVSPMNANGALTPNYGNELDPQNIEVEFGQLLYPAGGVDGTLTADADFDKVDSGTYINHFHSDQVSWNEVGTLTLTASVKGSDYLGTGLGAAVASDPYTVGRFYPAHFKLDSSSLSDGCNAFSYMGKAGISMNYQLSARNVADQVTVNYSTNFAPKATAAVVLENADDGIDLSGRMSSAAGTWQEGLMIVMQNDLTFTRSPDETVIDGPFHSLSAGIRLTDILDGRDFASGLKNMDTQVEGSCDTDCDAVALSNTLNLRYGRLRLIGGSVADAPTSGSVALPVQLQAEYWNGSNFVINTEDSFVAPSTPSCTQVNFNQVVVTSGSDAPTVMGSAPLQPSLTLGVSSLSPAAVYFDITPDTPVSVWPIRYNDTPLWLQYNWLQQTNPELQYLNPFSEISVGRYRGNKRQIFWQERLN
jgi:MSHA biogenesis protein MshQ